LESSGNSRPCVSHWPGPIQIRYRSCSDSLISSRRSMFAFSAVVEYSRSGNPSPRIRHDRFHQRYPSLDVGLQLPVQAVARDRLVGPRGDRHAALCRAQPLLDARDTHCKLLGITGSTSAHVAMPAIERVAEVRTDLDCKACLPPRILSLTRSCGRYCCPGSIPLCS
jgi:hypothetical protein